jgi:hypothetical protein
MWRLATSTSVAFMPPRMHTEPALVKPGESPLDLRGRPARAQ